MRATSSQLPRRAPIVALLLALGLAGAAAAAPFAVGDDPRVDPGDFEITTFASNLDFPLGLQVLSDGSLLVGVNRDTGGSLLNSAGELLRLVDADDDGVADEPGEVLFSGLDAVTSVRLAGDLVFVATGAIGSPRLVLLRRGAGPADPYTRLGSLDLALPLPWSHLTLSLAAREAPGEPGILEVFFNLGSREDAAATTDLVPVSGLWSGSLQPDSVYRVRVDDTGSSAVVTSVTRVAAGLRNAFGLAFHPTTGDLWLQDNGINGAVAGADPVSADELNRISAADLGVVVPDFGFPSSYVAYRTGAFVGGDGVRPEVAFQPLPPEDGEESEGPAELAFAPPGFPPGLNHGVFVGFHGEFSAGLANQENPLVYVDLVTGSYFHFVSNDEPAIGHLDSLVAAGDSLFVADLSSAGGLSTYGTGAIYRIRALTECENGLDDDGDGRIDFDPDRGAGDPGCLYPEWPREDPACQDGLDNDADDLLDFDGGASLDLDDDGFVDAQFNPAGPALTAPDPQCIGTPWRDRERAACGLGYELAFLLPPLIGLHRQRRRRIG